MISKHLRIQLRLLFRVPWYTQMSLPLELSPITRLGKLKDLPEKSRSPEADRQKQACIVTRGTSDITSGPDVL